MIDRLHRALENIDALPPEVQEQLAEIIEQHTEPITIPAESLAGAWSDLPDTFEKMLNALDQIRHASSPTTPVDEQLSWMDDDDTHGSHP